MSRKIQVAQTNFTAGEIDPLIAGRIDNKYYYTGAEKARNVIALPQGGTRRRPGLRYVDELRPAVSQVTAGVTATAPNGGTAANANDGDTTTLVTTTTNLSTTNNYVIVNYDLGSAKEIVFVDVMNFYLSAGSEATSNFKVQYSSDSVSWTDFGTSGFAIPASTTSTTRRFSNNSPKTVTARYWRFVRSGTGLADLGTAKANVGDFILWKNDGTLSSYREMNFTYSTTQAYLFVLTDTNIAVYKDSVWQADVRHFFSESQLSTINWTQSLDTIIFVHEDVQTFKVTRQGAHNHWQPSYITFARKPTHNFSNPDTTMTLTPAATSGTGILLTASSTYFTAGMVGQYVRGNGGFALITAQAGTTATVTIIEPYRFTNTNPIGAGDWSVEEDSWSSTWGWPRSVTFHEGRLWFGGSKYLPQTLWGSKSQQFFDFGSGSGLDDEAIEYELATDDVAAIEQIFSGRHLSVFTRSAEFYAPDTLDNPLTPSNFILKRPTSIGIKPGLRVISVSGAILFVQRYGKSIREFLWNDAEQSYGASNLSLLSSHLIVDPVDFGLRKSTSTDEADFCPIINSDGTLCLLTTLRDQSVTAFTLQITNGDFLAQAVVETDMYFIIERTINGTARRYIEKFDEDLLVDCGTDATRPSKNTYTASAGQTVFAFTNSVSSTDQLRVIKKTAATGVWSVLYPTTDYTTSALPGTGNITLLSACAAGDTVVISYPTSAFTGLSPIEGEDARVIGDGAVMNTTTVTSGTATVTGEKWDTYAQAGLDFPDVTGRGLGEQIWIKDMPVEPQLPEGVTASRKRRIVRAIAKLYETTHMRFVRLNRKNDPQFDTETLDPPGISDVPAEFTGDKIGRGLLGWDEFGQIEVTQVIPAKLTLLSLTKRVAI